ncbi:MAG TPA: dienelactone hydrolase family protein [Terriglobia bacterium]|nr:dienelactone hydrolase family protein [Terriglobia bacterium]
MEQFLTARIRCYYELELPRRNRAGKRWPLLIALHGFQGNKDSMMRVARRIADGRMIVASLQGPYQLYFRLGEDQNKYNVGFGWGTNFKMQESVELHHRNVMELIDRIVSRFRADKERVFLLGFSQACSFNYRFVFTYPERVRGVIAVCGGVPGDWDENPRYRRARTHVLHIGATQDEWYSREKNLEFRRQLAQRAASLDFRFYKSPHRFPRAAIPHIRRWILDHASGSSL